MKKTIIFSSILLILAFAGASHAQHVKVFDGSTGVLLSSSTTPNISAFAGQTVRLRIAAVNNRSRDVNDTYIFQSTARVVHGAVPCDASRSTGNTSTGLSAGKVSWSYNEAAKEHNYLLQTEKAWKGTCRIVSLTQPGGREYRAIVRFR